MKMIIDVVHCKGLDKKKNPALGTGRIGNTQFLNNIQQKFTKAWFSVGTQCFTDIKGQKKNHTIQSLL